MSKEEVYSQIDSFVNTRVGKSRLYEIKFYVDTQTAEDRANFTQWIFKNDKVLKNKEFNNIIDLCYGSGNLTSHILYESDIDIQNLILNDINVDDRNNAIEIGLKTNNDFLDDAKFEDRYDLIIFNPQIGGADTYEKGAVEFKKSVEPIIYDGTFEEYLSSTGHDTSGLTVSVDKIKKAISIHSDTLSKTDMTKMFKEIKIFNYYDVFYQSKGTKIEGEETNIVKFRKTLDKISNDNAVVIFLGEDAIYQTLFADYTYANIYLADEGKQLYILSKDEDKKVCYEYIENEFIVNEKCKKENNNTAEDLEIGEYLKELDSLDINEDRNNFLGSEQKNSNSGADNMKDEKAKEKFTNKALGKLNFSHKNLLLKGVPGTGKSKTIENIIENDLDMNTIKDNVLRINIHSASSNSDLMQGISISTDDKSNILYQEKRGAVLKHIFRAMFKPKQPFVLVLEEIQENSLNELIGDLIYLIEKDKRTEIKLEDDQELSYTELFEKVNPKHFVELPNLVEGSESNIQMIIPDNLYVFCTSNYRDDKKVIEDNLLRRFDVVEIYPKYYDKSWKNEEDELVFKSKDVSDFLAILNKEILEKFETETHPDRYLVGHANWLDITEEDSDVNTRLFYIALLKVIIEFKEIREVDFKTYVYPILKKLFDSVEEERIKKYLTVLYNEDESFKLDSYKEIVDKLQTEIYDFL